MTQEIIKASANYHEREYKLTPHDLNLFIYFMISEGEYGKTTKQRCLFHLV